MYPDHLDHTFAISATRRYGDSADGRQCHDRKSRLQKLNMESLDVLDKLAVNPVMHSSLSQSSYPKSLNNGQEAREYSKRSVSKTVG